MALTPQMMKAGRDYPIATLSIIFISILIAVAIFVSSSGCSNQNKDFATYSEGTDIYCWKTAHFYNCNDATKILNSLSEQQAVLAKMLSTTIIYPVFKETVSVLQKEK